MSTAVRVLCGPLMATAMPALDRYIDALLGTPGAQSLTFKGGSLVELMVNNSSRSLGKAPVTREQLDAALREVLPADYPAKVAGGSRDFVYAGPQGDVSISVLIVGDRLAARLTPSAVAQGGELTRPAAPASPNGPGAVANPAHGPTPNPPFTSASTAVSSAPAPAPVVAPASTTSIAALPAGIDELFHQMLDQRASDLHLKSGRPPMVRVDGEMSPLPGRAPIPADRLLKLLSPIIPDRERARFDAEKDIDFAYVLGGRGRMRCNIFEDIAGVGAVFRQIPTKILSAADLGLPAAVLGLCDHHKGLVLVTGPTGSGKSTTLAAMIDNVNATRADHIITIEDPVEFVHPDKKCLVNQREVGGNTMSFKNALRAALREDPDVVLVGELRDLETTAIAIETAETGHLVFATLHTNSAAATVDRVINQFPADRQAAIRMMLADSLVGVVTQTLCKKKGGGRVAAIELLIVTPAISNLIREEKTFQIPSIMQTSRGIGMQTMNDALLALAKAGTIEPDEAYSRSIQKREMGLSLVRAGYKGAWTGEPQ